MLCPISDSEVLTQLYNVLFVMTAVSAQVVEGQITWFVHMIGAIIKGRLTTGSTESQEVMDGELAARVLSLLKAADSQFHLARYGDTSRQRLDIALLTFFQHFRKVRPAPPPSALRPPSLGSAVYARRIWSHARRFCALWWTQTWNQTTAESWAP